MTVHYFFDKPRVTGITSGAEKQVSLGCLNNF
uniref:Uncharacterized protein n=1 Tax=Anguilla anguilla TaxID=7936 RepID=A0A0E9U2J7_ANGAN